MNNTCKTCETQKSPDDFYPNDRTCKPCRTAKVRANRLAKADQYKAYDKSRNMRPDRVEARAAYIATDAGKAAAARAHKSWEARHKKQKSANTAVSNAVRDRRLLKQPCFMCGEEKVEAHHADYDRALDVVWLCVPHHKEIHWNE